MGQCFLDYDGLKKFWKVVRANTVGLNKDGSITVNAINIKGYTDSYVLLAGGGLKPLSEFGSGSGSTSTINATLWGNSFDGTGNVNGDIVFNNPGSLSAFSQGIRLNKSGTNNAGVAVPAEGFIGFTAERGIQPNFHGISLGWGTNPEKSASSVRINDTTFTYKGNKILHTGNYTSIPTATSSTNGLMPYTDKIKLDKMPPTMFGAALVFYNNEILVDGIYGDYNLESGDATVAGYETIQENNHYITMAAFTITNNDLTDKLRNGYVKFGYSSKDNATYETMRLLQSNFDGSTLFVEFIHATPIGSRSFWFDCIWEVYPII